MRVKSVSYDHITRELEIVDPDGNRTTLPGTQMLDVTMVNLSDKEVKERMSADQLPNYIRRRYIIWEIEY